MTTAGTCQQRIQSASSSTPRLVAGNMRVSLARRAGLRSDGTRIVAATPALPMSMPHTRSRYSGSSVTSSTRPTSSFPAASQRAGTARGTGGERKNLTRVLEATMNGPWEDRLPASG